MSAKVSDLSRPQMRDIALRLAGNLKARADAGPSEPALDAFIPELDAVGGRLDTHVQGSDLADAARRALIAQLDVADDEVDTWLRHVEGFFHAESIRRTGAQVGQAQALRGAAFPDGLAPLDGYIPDENRYCRAALGVLRAQEHAATLAAIRFPMDWLTYWEAALDASDAAFRDLERARLQRSQHVSLGEDAEVDFADLALRLRRYVQSRASRRDTHKVAEGEALLAPLLDALKKMRTERLARATRRENAEAGTQAQDPTAPPLTRTPAHQPPPHEAVPPRSPGRPGEGCTSLQRAAERGVIARERDMGGPQNRRAPGFRSPSPQGLASPSQRGSRFLQRRECSGGTHVPLPRNHSPLRGSLEAGAPLFWAGEPPSPR